MNKLLALMPVVFAIFALMLSPAVMSVSAEKGGNGSEKSNAQSCFNEKGKAPEKNPNCDGNGNSGCGSDPLDCDSDGISDAFENENCTEFDNPDTDGDGVWDGLDNAPCDPGNQ